MTTNTLTPWLINKRSCWPMGYTIGIFKNIPFFNWQHNWGLSFQKKKRFFIYLKSDLEILIIMNSTHMRSWNMLYIMFFLFIWSHVFKETLSKIKTMCCYFFFSRNRNRRFSTKPYSAPQHLTWRKAYLLRLRCLLPWGVRAAWGSPLWVRGWVWRSHLRWPQLCRQFASHGQRIY